MWQPGGGAGNRAGATRANLKQANIKAKKCAHACGVLLTPLTAA